MHVCSSEDAGVKDVILLGAGASKSDGAPVQSALLLDYFAQYQQGPTGPANRKRHERLLHFLRDFYGLSVETEMAGSGKGFAPFEELLAMIELAVGRHQDFKRTGLQRGQIESEAGSSTSNTLAAIKEDLVFSIAEVIGRSFTEPKRHHRMLIERLMKDCPNDFSPLDQTGFISLNYDLLLDNALFFGGKRSLDYGFEFSNDGLNPDEIMGHSSIYKLHGSLNWLYCPECDEMKHTGTTKGALKIAFGQGVLCKCGNRRLLPFVVPPTFLKDLSDFRLQMTWHAAERMLRNADRLFICGYSMPDADIQVKYLLKRAEMNRTSEQGKLKAYVINNHEGKEDPVKMTEACRFQRFFKCDVCYTDLSFEEFSKDGIESLR